LGRSFFPLQLALKGLPEKRESEGQISPLAFLQSFPRAEKVLERKLPEPAQAFASRLPMRQSRQSESPCSREYLKKSSE